MAYLRLAIALLTPLTLFLNSWILIPAPTMIVFSLTVGVPELSPLFLAGNIVLLLSAIASYQPTLSWQIILGCLSLSLILSSLPLLQLSTSLHQAHDQMEAVLGHDYLSQIPSEKRQKMRSHPILFRDLIQGINAPAVECDRHSLLISTNTSLPLNIYRPIPKTQNSTEPTPTPGQERDQACQNPRSKIQNPKLPTLITLYGGGWHNGHPDKTADFSQYMATQGYVVVAIAYRHAPDHQFPTQLDDIQTALHWIAEHQAEYDIDPSRLALVGWSAGAHLALLTAYQSFLWPPRLNIRAVVNYYGPIDLAEGYRDLPRPDPINGPAVLTSFLGGTPTDYPERYREASPLYQIRAGLPPTLSIYGDRDHIVKPIFGQRLDQQLRHMGNTSMLLRLPWAEHAFDRIFQGLGSQIALYYIEHFLAQTL